jgi:hypothetical protein
LGIERVAGFSISICMEAVLQEAKTKGSISTIRYLTGIDFIIDMNEGECYVDYQILVQIYGILGLLKNI